MLRSVRRPRRLFGACQEESGSRNFSNFGRDGTEVGWFERRRRVREVGVRGRDRRSAADGSIQRRRIDRPCRRPWICGGFEPPPLPLRVTHTTGRRHVDMTSGACLPRGGFALSGGTRASLRAAAAPRGLGSSGASAVDLHLQLRCRQLADKRPQPEEHGRLRRQARQLSISEAGRLRIALERGTDSSNER